MFLKQPDWFALEGLCLRSVSVNTRRVLVGLVGCLPSAAAAPHPHPQASEGAGLANKATKTRSPSGSGSAESLGKLATAGVALVRQWPWPLEASQPVGAGVGFPWRGGSCQKIKWTDIALWDLKRDTLLQRGSPYLVSPQNGFSVSPLVPPQAPTVENLVGALREHLGHPL